MKFCEKLKNLIIWKNFGKTVKFSENFRKFWRDAFTSGKYETQFWCYKEFLKKLEIDNNEMCQRILIKYWENFPSIFKILQFLQKF